MPKTVEHTWRERGEGGEIRRVRAFRRSGTWYLSSKHAGDEVWTPHDPIPLEDLRSLRDVLWRKYQRRRVAFEALAEIDGKIEALAGEAGGEAGGEEA